MSTSDDDACIGCGRPTRVGTTLFSDRRSERGDDETTLWLCADCNERAISHFGRQPGERDMIQIAARGADSVREARGRIQQRRRLRQFCALRLCGAGGET